MIVHIGEKDQIKYFAKITLVKSNSSMSKLLLDFPAAVINYLLTI